MVLLWERLVDWFYQSLPKSQSTLHVVLKIPRRCICLSTVLAGMMRPSLQCCRAPSFEVVDWFHQCIAVRWQEDAQAWSGRKAEILLLHRKSCTWNVHIAGAGNVYNSLLVRRQVGVYWSLCTVVHCMMLPSLSCGFEQQQQWCCLKRNSWLVACLPICCTFDIKWKRWSSAKLM